MKIYKKRVRRLLSVMLAVFLAAGCRSFSDSVQPVQPEAAETAEAAEAARPGSEETEAAETEAARPGGGDRDEAETNGAETAELPVPGLPEAFSLSMVPEYSGSIWADVNGDVPFFDERQREAARRLAKALSLQHGQEETDLPDDLPDTGDQTDALEEGVRIRSGSYQVYGELDALGRCTGACALVGPETLPREGRGQIGMIRPTGWHNVKYDGIDGNYLYNRCHLIGFQLTGQDANEKNLITGTRSMNAEGMLPYEESVLAYVRGTGNHVLYRVTPVFRQDNLLADGVLMEACSVEDPLVRFCAFCYNVQPGVQIDYATGESTGPAFSGDKNIRDKDVPDRSLEERQDRAAIGEWKYIINVSSMKFHRPGCESVQKMSRKNMQGFDGDREELIEMGYEPCKNCNP